MFTLKKTQSFGAANQSENDDSESMTLSEIDSYNEEVKNICEVFADNVKLFPKATALDYKGKKYTYETLDKITNQLARAISNNYLQVMGKPLSRDALIPLSIRRSADYVICILAILKAGGAYVPINPEYPMERINYILDDIESDLIFVEQAAESVFRKCERLKRIIIVSDALYSHLSEEALAYRPSCNDLAYVIYTSGSTGKPKGILAKHVNVISQVICASYLRMSHEDTVTFFSDVSFDSTTVEIWSALLHGATLYIPEDLFNLLSNPDLFKETVRNKAISVVLMTRALFDLLFSLDETAFKDIRILMVGGEALTKHLMQRLMNSGSKPDELINAYGPSENSTFCTTFEINTDFSHLNSVPIGRPYTNRVAYILDKYEQLMPVGFPGEIVVGGTSLSRGYLNRADLTKEKFIKNPYFQDSGVPYTKVYKTGDLAKWLPDGNIEFAGRNDFQVKLRGYRIELCEIEERLLEHPSIKHAVVVMKKQQEEGYLLGYYVSNHAIDESVLRAHLASRLPEYMIPSVFVYLKTLPVTTNGKLDRKALPEPTLHTKPKKHEVPIKNTEKVIREIWSSVLGIESFERDHSFFELGGNSLSAMRVRKQLEDAFATQLNIVELFEYPTLASLANRVNQLTGENTEELVQHQNHQDASDNNQDVAIVGMSCRLPGINSVEDYWSLLVAGETTLTEYTDDELSQWGVSKDEISDDSYVKRGGLFRDVFAFDAAFFGYSAKDATIMDPQQRHFLECAWEALEHSGNIPSKYDGDIGVFASQGRNYYFMDRVYADPASLSNTNIFQAILNNEKDFLSTRVSFKLNLTGPSITLQTACSSSLVSIQMACESLRNFSCDMALAGGVSLFYKPGYRYQDDMIESPDGYCRAFDKNAKGTVVTSGVGIIAIKRLADAIRDKDTVYAVIKGGAINNDGSDKMGFTAPSVRGQSAAIAKAIRNAKVDPETITYIESHGTGTILGDPIEWKALHNTFASLVGENYSGKIGAVKTNIGHTDSAAGVLGLIKTTLSLYHDFLPATLNFHELNPEIKQFNRLFSVNSTSEKWLGDSKRAGVSSFGLGGTNAHVILEEYKSDNEIQCKSTSVKIIPISAKTSYSLAELKNRYLKFIGCNDSMSINNLAYTSYVGREEFNERAYLIVDEGSKEILHSYTRNTHFQRKQKMSLTLGAGSHAKLANYEYLYARSTEFKTLFDEFAESYSESVALNLAFTVWLNNFDVDARVNSKSSEDDISSELLLRYDISCDINDEWKHNAIDVNTSTVSIRNEVEYLAILGWLWAHGCSIQFEKYQNFDKASRRIAIPTYAFEHKKFELEKPMLSVVEQACEEMIENDQGTNFSAHLKSLWSDILGIDVSDIDEGTDFFDLGGDSLALIDLMSLLKKSHSINLELDDLVNTLEFSEMLELIEQKHMSEAL